MKKLFHLVQWAVVIAVILFTVRALTRPVPPPNYHPETWSSWQGFYVLSFAGISRDNHPDYVAPARLTEHLQALREAGYQTIFPEDALAFLDGRHALPEKAVLLLFENGRKDSFIMATPRLQREGAVATMCVPTIRTRRWSTFYLRHRDLQKLARSPHWRLASMGHRAVENVVDARGRKGHYLTARLRKDDVVENDEAFQARIMGDFAEAQRMLARAGVTQVQAYLFPFADAGTSAEADPQAAEIILQALATCHPLAFTRADDAYNGPSSDPFQLSRLRVPGSWSAQDLLNELEHARPRFDRVTEIGSPGQWTLEGASEVADGELRLGSGAQAWRHGSSDWADGTVNVGFHRGTGVLASIYLRYAGPYRHLRLSVQDDGLRLQERLGRTLQTLFMQPLAGGTGTGESHQITVRLRGKRVWLEDHGVPLAGPLPLTTYTARGRLGFAAENGALEIATFSAEPSDELVGLAGDFRAMKDEDQDRLTALVVPWFARGSPPVVSEGQRYDLLAAAAEGLTYIPLIEGTDPLTPEQARTWAGALNKALDHTMTKTLVHKVALREPVHPLAEALRERGYQVVRVLDQEQAQALLRDASAHLQGDSLLVLNVASGTESTLAGLARLAPADRLAIEAEPGAARPIGLRRIEQF